MITPRSVISFGYSSRLNKASAPGAFNNPGKYSKAKFKNEVLKAHISYANSKIEPKYLDQAFVPLPDQIEERLKKVLPLSKDTSGFKRKAVPDFTIDV